MATQVLKTTKFLRLGELTVQGDPKSKYKLALFLGNEEIELQRKDIQTWTPVQRPYVSSTSQMRVEIQMKSGHLTWVKRQQTSNIIDLQMLANDHWTSAEHETIVSEAIVVGKHHYALELRFFANATPESLRLSLEELQELLGKHSPLMSTSTERALEKVFKYGAAIAESNYIAKVVFSAAQVTFELLKEQNEYDRVPSGLFDRMQRILPLADKVVDEIVYEEMEIFGKVVPRMFEVMQSTVKLLCDNVKLGRFERVKHGLVDTKEKEMIEKIGGELTGLIEDFMRGVDVEALCSAKRSEQELLLGRLKSVPAGYHLDFRCMEGTRKSILKEIIDWVNNKLTHDDVFKSNVYWLYGLPGIGKTALAHSICASLHDRDQLAGAFFCRRDDVNLSEPRNILPTLINKLAGIFPPFRNIVAKRLSNDPHLTPETMQDFLFIDFIRSVPRRPSRTLVFVIDALDECGTTQTRPGILRTLTNAATQAPWLKIIITSRPEADIQYFFDSSTHPSHIRRDLATNGEAGADLRIFAQSQLKLVASKWYLSSLWPGESMLDRITTRANGLFIFIKTLILALEDCEDPDESLNTAMQDSDGTGLKPLYGLYSSILKARKVPRNTEFQRVIGALLITAPHRSLCDETIAELAGVKPNLVKKWVDDLGSLLYRDVEDHGGIRVRHLSISEFFVSEHCDYQVRLQDAHVHLGIACLKTMINQLRFNICKLEDSRLSNADVEDLESRTKQHISDALWYSCRYWANHLCFTPNNGEQDVMGSLREFFEGLYPILWIEVLSILRMVSIGAPSLRRAISCFKDTDSTLLERIEDICRFIITFHTPISISTPHIYISTGPFLPSQSPLSATFSTYFTKAIRMRKGNLLSWPELPLQWVGHTAHIRCVQFSPDGSHIVTGSFDHTVRIWDTETGTVVGQPLKGHTGNVRSVAYSPDGRRIISGSDDKTIRIWDAGTGDVVGRSLEGHTDRVLFVRYSPNGEQIISGSSDNTIRIWDVKTGAVACRPLKGCTGRASAIACSLDGHYITTGFSDGTIIIWDAETCAAVYKPLKGHAQHVSSIAHSPDECHVVSGSLDKTLRIWDCRTGAVVGFPLWGHNANVSSVSYSPNGRHIVSGSWDHTIVIWDAGTGTIVRRLKRQHYWVGSVVYSPDGWHIVSGAHNGIMQMWDAETGAAVGRAPDGHNLRVKLVAYSPDGRRIISGSDDETIRIWDAATGVPISKTPEGCTGLTRVIACSPDGRHIASESNYKALQIMDSETGTLVRRPLEGYTGGAVSIAYSPDGRHVLSGGALGGVQIWDVETGATVGNLLERHTDRVSSIAFSPDGCHIVTGSWDMTIQIWDAKAHAAVGEPLKGHTTLVLSVAYSPNGRHIISGSADCTIRIWDANAGTVVGEPLVGHTGLVNSVAYSSDGRYIISGSQDKTIRIWDAESGTVVGKPLEGHGGPVYTIACSPDGQHIISGSEDKSIHVWDSFPHTSIQLSSHDNINAPCCALPDPDGWVRDSVGGLLYWVPPDFRTGLHSPALLTIPPTSHTRSVSLDFEDFAFGTSWTQIFSGAQP